MRRQQYIPYFFDYKYERRTYKYIGRDYGDHIMLIKAGLEIFQDGIENDYIIKKN